MLGHVLIELPNTLLVYLPIVGVVSDQSRKAVLSLEGGDLLVEGFYLIVNELTDTHGFLPIVYLQFFVLGRCLGKEFFLIDFEESANLLDDFLPVLHELVMDAFSEAHQIIVYFIIGPVELFKEYDILITFLFCFHEYFLQVDIGGFVVL